MTARRILFIINPAAGKGQTLAACAKLERQLEGSQLKLARVIASEPGDAMRLAKEAAPRYEVLVAVGGDGTASEVANGILTSGAARTALSILPCGTGNDIATALGIRDRADTTRALVEGQSRLVDAIEVQSVLSAKPSRRFALLFAAVGITSELLKRTTTSRKRLLGRPFAYRLALLQALWTYSAPRMRVTCDGQVVEDRYLLLCASNAETAGGGIRIAPGARMDDGRLNVNLIQSMGRWAAFGQVRRLGRGEHINHPHVRYLSSLSLSVEAEPPIEVAADGDLIGRTPARFEVKPNSLSVLV
ncbi:MAG TPA: diacylglycerol kinase family protein [Candidatus Binatia bacterium]|jgi:diacylglycerol kinase (ATP)|nr:diacylglycerol kinase family protein [Candidatus Binatia bacterium]